MCKPILHKVSHSLLTLVFCSMFDMYCYRPNDTTRCKYCWIRSTMTCYDVNRPSIILCSPLSNTRRTLNCTTKHVAIMTHFEQCFKKILELSLSFMIMNVHHTCKNRFKWRGLKPGHFILSFSFFMINCPPPSRHLCYIHFIQKVQTGCTLFFKSHSKNSSP